MDWTLVAASPARGTPLTALAPAYGELIASAREIIKKPIIYIIDCQFSAQKCLYPAAKNAIHP
ncbi:hypothetical protein [Rugamonas sp.]|uniref:hypothetical protein n=1 Tax=Rugamonas sp. TaxID=1926287 RepID=UPI0025CC154C|nr:hypothetical protein [Rugamonas sp.]